MTDTDVERKDIVRLHKLIQDAGLGWKNYLSPSTWYCQPNTTYYRITKGELIKGVLFRIHITDAKGRGGFGIGERSKYLVKTFLEHAGFHAEITKWSEGMRWCDYWLMPDTDYHKKRKVIGFMEVLDATIERMKAQPLGTELIGWIDEDGDGQEHYRINRDEVLNK